MTDITSAGVLSRSVQVGTRTLTIETGRMAWQADGAVTVTCGDTVLLVTVTSAKAREGTDFFPLTVEYRARRAAAGRFMGGYRKRENRPSDQEVLGSRITDRTIRPLFPDGFRMDVQVIAQVLSAEPDLDPSVLAVTGASAALCLSSLPWEGPAAAVRVAEVGGQLVVFPSEAQREGATLDLIVSTGPDGLLMVEGGAAEASEARVVEALLLADRAMQPLLAVQRELRGRDKLVFVPQTPEALERLEPWREPLARAYATPRKSERKAAVAAVRAAVDATLGADGLAAWGDLEHEVARAVIVGGTRFDGRRFDEVRPIRCETGLLPRTHGSALFSRGETQALATAVLGSPSDREINETLFGEVASRFYLHYNFPPFSTGETKPLRGPGRREIGHGALAQRALEAVFPAVEDFPYTVRVISDILSSNGSSSMASVCGGVLAMYDAGVPLRAPVAGVAMGLIEHAGGHVVLTDILGDEDHLGDMDFKVCGTRKGITALQMDIKVKGLTEDVLTRALAQARAARLHILDRMHEALAGPRPELSPHAPRILGTQIPPDRIGELIGPGGRNIKEIQAESGARVEVDDTGMVTVSAATAVAAKAALDRIRSMFREPVVGEIIDGRVKNLTDSVAFVELFPGTEGVLHVSDWAEGRTASMRDVAKPGDLVRVKITGVTRQGRIAVSRREALSSGA
ncbi:MAG: polyribonucleotide nucleotidyltransferase [Myxococcales bacterium]